MDFWLDCTAQQQPMILSIMFKDPWK